MATSTPSAKTHRPVMGHPKASGFRTDIQGPHAVASRQQSDTTAKSEACYHYGQWVLDQSVHRRFGRIVTSKRLADPIEGTSWLTTETPVARRASSFLEKRAADGTPVTALRDVPDPGNVISNVPDSLAVHNNHHTACTGMPTSRAWIDPPAAAPRNWTPRRSAW